MMARPVAVLVRAASALAVALALAGCTPGGQFDPSELMNTELFAKKKIQGEREPLFPNGVPGAETGVPPDLVKGYQAPQQAAVETTESVPKPAAPAAEAKAKPKPKPRPKVARAPAAAPAATPAAQDPVWGGQKSAAQPQQHDPVWDQKSASPQQSPWPAQQSTAPAQQTAQPAQSVWPNPPAPNTR